ncbi:ABC transporter permease subunit [Prochlorococcus marinus]|uniref:Putative phosphonate ABC transporter n=1 Tax=Prochlorococcus marinus (strain MIT 9211) TaxID=93059 RepID=A9BA53_PROM4|nr:ABC transporter permease subunit [Prochlorococcus marinus]ABX08715.1 putative phosphonate ABC transporter [Prochlorococcus marinus str. MIT 9211]
MPAIALVPVGKSLVEGFHTGGVNIIVKFLLAAFQPSINRLVIESSFNSLKTTISIAIIAWAISLLNGIFLGVITSNIFTELFKVNLFWSKILKYSLTVPRAIHEVIWGLLLLQVFGLNPYIAIISISIPYSALIARVFAEQINSLDIRSLVASKHSGAGPFETLVTALTPKIIPIIGTYGGYRLECALRGATLLGIFGLGGIGTELTLSIRSLEFNEMWTSLWMLGIILFFLEKVITWIQTPSLYLNNIFNYTITASISILILLVVSILWLNSLDLGISRSLVFYPIQLPSIQELIYSFNKLSWASLISQTICLTLFAAGIAIGLPPILLSLWPSKLGEEVISFLWIVCRLIPAPLSALILLMCSSPSIAVASLALGIQNMGVMGRILKESINNKDLAIFNAIKSLGADKRSAFFYGRICPQSNSYLAYSAYRTDVILRETVLVGVVGGSGLGWQLRESISSFNWSEVILLTATFGIITLTGELLSDHLQYYLLKEIKPKQPLLHLKLHS